MIGLLLLACAAAAFGLDAPWWLRGLLVTPALVLGAGSGLARWLGGTQDRLAHLLHAGWLGLGLTWVDVALVRELGLRGATAGFALLGLAALWGALGLGLARRRGAARPTAGTRWTRLGVLGVLLCVLGVGLWRADDVARPLDGYWFAQGADDPPQEPVDLRPGPGWAAQETVGWAEAGALRLVPAQADPTFATVGPLEGRVTVAVRGPVGTTLSVAGASTTIARSMVEEPEEGPVRRYLERGTAALVLELDLPAGAELPLALDGPAAPDDLVVYLMPGSDAVWALHAAGELRYTHYYQILNQVENQVWAQEVLVDRWFTWNQPPGWSPILATSTVLVQDDLPAAGLLLLWVLVFVGLHGVRLGALLAPAAPTTTALVPGALAAAHGLLMFEPASVNFPDSLYAAAVLATAAAVVERRPGWFGGLGAATQALRWPGTVVALLLLGVLSWSERENPLPYALRLLGLIALGGAAALAAALTGQADDLLFILYFETFPEHWHDDYAAGSLLPRIPGFYGRWLAYTGGGLALAAGALLLARPGPERRAGRGLLAAALAYSALLCTIDHHPTHYFLPLVALTGPLLIAGAGATRRAVGEVLGALTLVGVAVFLSGGRVW